MIFDSSGYRYTMDAGLKVGAIRKQNFGFKNRLALFNDIITAAGVEFNVSGKVVAIYEQVGSDLSTVVRKNFNLNELKIKRNVGDFITYARGFGAYYDENDHSKGRLMVEYESPLAKQYGRLEAEPITDERYTVAENLLAVVKKRVEDSYSISIELTLEDLRQAGYNYTAPQAGDYIMAINETLGFKERIRIVSYQTNYDVTGQVIDHQVTCNDIGMVKKQAASYAKLGNQVRQTAEDAETAAELANRALISANGKNTNYYGADFPKDEPKGTLRKGDILFLQNGDKTLMYSWNGAEWIASPVNDMSQLEAELAQVAKDVEALPTSEEITDEIQRNRTEIEDQVASASKAAEEKAKSFAQEINNRTHQVANEANKLSTTLQADLAKAKTDLTALGNTALIKADEAKRAVDDAKRQIANLNNQITTDLDDLYDEISRVDRARADVALYAAQNRDKLTKQAKDILAQAQAQTELVRRTETVEQTLDGQRTTITELGKSLDSATGQIQSVGNRTKTVEDGLSALRTSYQNLTAVVNPLTGQIQSVEQRTATIETGVNGIRESLESARQTLTRQILKTAQFERDANGIRERLTSVEENSVKNLSGNMLVESSEGWVDTSAIWLSLGDELEQGKTYTAVVKGAKADYTPHFWTDTSKPNYISAPMTYDAVLGAYVATITAPSLLTTEDRVIVTFGDGKTADVEYVTLVQGKLPLVPWAPHWSEIKAQLAEYTAEYKRTAQGMTERLTALEVYKNSEGQRATDYFERAKTETARQRAEVWKAVQDGYVANATYTEDARGIQRQYNEIRTLATGAQSTANAAKDAASTADRKAVTVTQTLATYKTDVDQQLTRLQQNQRTADGLIASLDASMRLVPGQITTAVSAVEGKIPTEVGARNYLLDSDVYITSGNKQFNLSPDFAKNAIGGKSIAISFELEASGLSANGGAFTRIGFELSVNLSDGSKRYYNCWINGTSNSPRKRYSFVNEKIPDGLTIHNVNYCGLYIQVDGTVRIGKPKLELSQIVTDWSPAPEDLITDISSVQTTVTQTADGVRQLSTKVTTAEGNITTAQADIRRLNDIISSRLSETAINDIKNKVQTVESLYEQTTTSFTQRLTDVITKLPKGYSGNMLVNSGKGWSNQAQMDYILAEPIVKGQTYTIAAKYSRQSGVTKAPSISFWLIAAQTTEGINQHVAMAYDKDIDAWVATFTAEGNAPAGKTVILTMTRGSASWATLAKGNLAIASWTPSVKDVTDQIDAKASEIRQEIGRIDLSVQGIRGDMLHKNSITVQDDGIVLKAGKTQGDVAKAIASYFKLTPEAVSIITPLIKVRGDMIVDGAITATKIDAASIRAAILVADIIKSTMISADAVEARAIKAGAVTTAKIAANAVTADKITANAVTTDKLNANAVTAAKIATGAITAGKIAAGTVTATEIATSAITSAKIAANAIDASKIVSSAVTADKIAANAITANHITAAGITADKIKGGTLTATNNNMRLDLNNGQVLFYNSQAALKRVLSGYPTQFVKFDTGLADGRATGVTVIGSNRNGNEDSNGGGFVGLRLWNGAYTSNGQSKAVDLADVVADRVSFSHSGFNDNPKGFYMENWADSGAPRFGAFGAYKEQSKIEIGDVMMWSDKNQGQLVGLRNLLIDMASEINRLSGRTVVDVPFYKSVFVAGTNAGWQSYK